MDPGELAADVKAGKEGAMCELWEAVRRFVVMKAEQRAARPGCRVPAEDFIQAGFFAMLDAAEAYDPEREHGFLKLLAFTLKKRFAEEQGFRSSKRDALFYASSADVPAVWDDPEGPTIAEVIPDESAELPFLGVEYADFLEYCRGTINAALATVSPRQAETIRAHYSEGMSLDEIGARTGITRQSVFGTEQRAFYRLMRGKYRRLLRDCLDTFTEFHNCEAADYIARPTEAAAMKRA